MIHVIQLFCTVIFSYFMMLWSAENRSMDDVIVKVVVSSDNYSLREVNMEGNRYKFADDRQIEFKENDWTRLILRPLARKTNLRYVVSSSIDSQDNLFVTELLSRCVGKVDSVENTADGYLVNFDNWYDNHYTGFIRYYLTEKNNCNKNSLNMSVFDKYDNEHIYQISIGDLVEKKVSQQPSPAPTNLRGKPNKPPVGYPSVYQRMYLPDLAKESTT